MVIEARIMIIEAIAASVTSGAIINVAKNPVAKAYKNLKESLIEKFGPQHPFILTLEWFEADPQSQGYKVTLEEQIKKAKLEEDPELINLAKKLLDLLEDRQSGKQNIVQNISNVKYAATSATGNASIGNITENPESSK
ncbi:MAG: hypothetical protein ACFBSE_11520 [Prochloraceae cyanobacterium]